MSVPNVDRCLRLIESLAAMPEGASLGTLARSLDVPKSAAHRLLRALLLRGYVAQHPDTGDYRLSLKVALLGFRYLESQRLPDIGQAVLDLLARGSGEYCRMAALEGDELIWVAQAQGAAYGLRYEPAMGREVVLHATATGKAWLASLPEERALALVDRRGLSTPRGFGPRVVRTLDELRQHLRETRRRGYALAVDEGEPGIVALATVFRAFDAPDAPVAGTVSIAGPRVRLGEERVRQLAPLLASAARQLAELWPLRERQATARRPAAVPPPAQPAATATP